MKGINKLFLTFLFITTFRVVEFVSLSIITLHLEVTRKEIAENLGRTDDSIRYYLRKMTAKGIIRHEGPTKSGRWIRVNR